MFCCKFQIEVQVFTIKHTKIAIIMYTSENYIFLMLNTSIKVVRKNKLKMLVQTEVLLKQSNTGQQYNIK